MGTLSEEVKFDHHPRAEELFQGIKAYVEQQLEAAAPIEGKRRVYYISAEFLLGKMLKNHLLNLHLYEECDDLLRKYGYTMRDLEEWESEPSLGNGGLGRLAACYLESGARLGYALDGIGLCYHFGLFKQRFVNHKQVETMDPWLNGIHFLRRSDVVYPVRFGHTKVSARMYEMDIPAKDGRKNTLHLFDLEGVKEDLVEADGIAFDPCDITHNLTLFLYPDDSTKEGKLLRIYQQYFMCSCAAQYILDTHLRRGKALRELPEAVMIQINDTHPAMIIPELIRLLMREGMTMKEAIEVVSDTCAYTNHTILAEALETWPLEDLKQVVPQLVTIIEALDAIGAYRGDPASTRIIDERQRVHMAHIAIHYGSSVNGVAALHTDILKQHELRDFYACYPAKFHNVTNGISFTRFLYGCNRELSKCLEETIGNGFYEDETKLKELLKHRDDSAFLYKLREVKQEKKRQFCEDIAKRQGIILHPESIFDVQIKRLHEYKRQQMNALDIIHRYLDIKQGIFPKRAITYIFGAKAAPAYTIAKDIIHLLLCLQKLIESDEQARDHLKVCFVENYNVSCAETLIPAADLSEQISLASKEASGTGNMKLMANGAVTIGTADGANVEIGAALGDEAIYLFGESAAAVLAHYDKKDYQAKAYYERDPWIKAAVDFIIDPSFCQIGDVTALHRLHRELIEKDWFMTLLDIKAYHACRNHAYDDYENSREWAEKMLINIANCAYFSADRAIREYAENIWHL